MRSAGTGRRETDNFVTAITCSDRFPQFDLVLAEIIRRNQPSILAHPAIRAFGEFVLVKPIGPLVGDGSIAAGEIRLAEQLTRAIRFSIGFQKYSASLAKMRKLA